MPSPFSMRVFLHQHGTSTTNNNLIMVIIIMWRGRWCLNVMEISYFSLSASSSSMPSPFSMRVFLHQHGTSTTNNNLIMVIIIMWRGRWCLNVMEISYFSLAHISHFLLRGHEEMSNQCQASVTRVYWSCQSFLEFKTTHCLDLILEFFFKKASQISF